MCKCNVINVKELILILLRIKFKIIFFYIFK
jgi:hypothetical protein